MLPLKSIYKTIFFLAAIIQILVLAVPVFGSIVDRVVAKVNNEIITLSTVKSKVALSLNRIGRPYSENFKETEKKLTQETLDSIIDEKLQAQEATKMGLMVKKKTIDKAIDDIYKNNNITASQFNLMLEKDGYDFASYEKIIHDQILSSRVVAMQLQDAPLSSNRDALKYYKINKKKYWVPSEVIVSQIMFINEKDALQSDIKLKRIKAGEILGLLRSGSDFSGLAKKYSEDITGPLGGRVGTIKRGTTLPKFEKIAFNLKLNEVSNVFQTENGIHIIRCDDIKPGYFKGYKDVKPEIKRLLDLKNKDKKYLSWMKNLRKSAFIEVKLFDKPRIRQSISRTNKEIVGEVRSKRVTKKVSTQNKDKLSKLSIETKLRYLRKLRHNKKISNQKYLEKKKALLRKF